VYNNVRDWAETQRSGGAPTEAFERLKSYYLFDSHFCLVRRPNEKGHVGNLVGSARPNFLVPVAVADDMPSLNDVLTRRCREGLNRCARGQTATNAERLAGQLPALLAVPATPFERIDHGYGDQPARAAWSHGRGSAPGANTGPEPHQRRRAPQWETPPRRIIPRPRRSAEGGSGTTEIAPKRPSV
jgi:hypothetical protein